MYTFESFIFFALAVARLFTPKIASYYEDYYIAKGVKFIKGTVMSSFDMDPDGKVMLLLTLFPNPEFFCVGNFCCWHFCSICPFF